MMRKSTPGRLGFWLKYGSMMAVAWMFIHAYFTFRNNELEKTYIAANNGIKEIQDKIAELIQKNDNDYDNNFNQNENYENRQNVEALQEQQNPNQQQDDKSIELDDGITPQMRDIIKRLGFVNPGMNGEPVELPKNMSEDLQQMKDRGYRNHAYNTFASAMIGLNRYLPDTRSEDCKTMKYHENLPKCSVIIIFHNEDWFALMRTVHSVIRHSPIDLIEEILLVDDASDMGEFGYGGMSA